MTAVAVCHLTAAGESEWVSPEPLSLFPDHSLDTEQEKAKTDTQYWRITCISQTDGGNPHFVYFEYLLVHH